MICSKLITAVFNDVYYSINEQQFINNFYSVKYFSYIKYISTEAVLKVIQCFTTSYFDASANISVQSYLLFVKALCTVGVFILNFYVNLVDPILQIIVSQGTIDICCILPYMVILFYLNKVQSFNSIKDVEEQRTSTEKQDTVLNQNRNSHSSQRQHDSSIQFSNSKQQNASQSSIGSTFKLHIQQQSIVQFKEARQEEELYVDSFKVIKTSQESDIIPSQQIESQYDNRVSETETDLDTQILEQERKKWAKPKKPLKLIEQGKNKMNAIDAEPLPKLHYEPSSSDFFK
ncbi:Hypothetical_protein [Hexamita inflata]|uniref:Hypothetical_protein n=1 Tax=Hexamita inflata TaxID=28002 RepID=A0AA86QGD5_9EUKA|nr:Hypothetical protein HINF_LOCUS43886 [Hexamita inflata]